MGTERSGRHGREYLGQTETDSLLRDSPTTNPVDESDLPESDAEEKEAPTPFDNAMNRIGFGYGQIAVLMAAAMANAADSVELAAVSFAITTTMECDLELNAGRKGWYVSAALAWPLITRDPRGASAEVFP